MMASLTQVNSGWENQDESSADIVVYWNCCNLYGVSSGVKDTGMYIVGPGKGRDGISEVESNDGVWNIIAYTGFGGAVSGGG